MEGIGKLLVLVGVIFVLVGAALWAGFGKGWLGRLPGDISIEKGGLYFLFSHRHVHSYQHCALVASKHFPSLKIFLAVTELRVFSFPVMKTLAITLSAIVMMTSFSSCTWLKEKYAKNERASAAYLAAKRTVPPKTNIEGVWVFSAVGHGRPQSGPRWHV